jgi:hypothetical protein
MVPEDVDGLKRWNEHAQELLKVLRSELAEREVREAERLAKQRAEDLRRFLEEQRQIRFREEHFLRLAEEALTRFSRSRYYGDRIFYVEHLLDIEYLVKEGRFSKKKFLRLEQIAWWQERVEQQYEEFVVAYCNWNPEPHESSKVRVEKYLRLKDKKNRQHQREIRNRVEHDQRRKWRKEVRKIKIGLNDPS